MRLSDNDMGEINIVTWDIRGHFIKFMGGGGVSFRISDIAKSLCRI